MIKDTCLGRSGVAAPLLQKSDLESPLELTLLVAFMCSGHTQQNLTR
jgi:hypothetical protein